MSLQPIHTDAAPKAVGAYSQAIQCGNILYTSGQIGLNPNTGEMVGDDVASQAQQVVKNLTAVITQAGGSLNQIVKVTIFLEDMADFAEVNQIYASLKELSGEDRGEFLDGNRGKLRQRKRLQATSKKLRQLKKRRDRIMDDKDMGRSEKQIKLNAVQRQMNKLSRRTSLATEKAF